MDYINNNVIGNYLLIWKGKTSNIEVNLLKLQLSKNSNSILYSSVFSVQKEINTISSKIQSVSKYLINVSPKFSILMIHLLMYIPVTCLHQHTTPLVCLVDRFIFKLILFN